MSIEGGLIDKRSLGKILNTNISYVEAKISF